MCYIEWAKTQDGKEVHIKEVANGLKCGCFCLCCNEPLVAKNNPDNVKVAHFAHYGVGEGEHCYETYLHHLAKHIIEAEGKIWLPALENEDRYSTTPLKEAKEYSITNVRIEKRLHDIVPDVVVEIDGQPLIIEIFVTSKVKRLKIEKIKEQDTSAFEINLSKYKKGKVNETDPEMLKNIIIGNSTEKHWIYNRTQAQRQKQYYEKKKAEQEAQQKKRIEEYRLHEKFRMEAEANQRSTEHQKRASSSIVPGRCCPKCGRILNKVYGVVTGRPCIICDPKVCDYMEHY